MTDYLSRPFVAGDPPLFDGKQVAHISGRKTADGIFDIDIRERGGAFAMRISAGPKCYVIDGIRSVGDALAVADKLPAPNDFNTHTRLRFISERDGDFIVRIVSGENVGQQVGPGDVFMTEDGRSNLLTYHRLSEYRSEASEIRIQAFDLQYIAMSFDERYHREALTGRRAGIITSTWIHDGSDYLKERSVNYHFAKRHHADGDAISPTIAQRLRAMDAEDAAKVHRSRADLFPINGPIEPLSRTKISPSAEDNFRYVTKSNPDDRKTMRYELLAKAIETARDLPPPHVPDMADRLDFAGFRASRQTWERVEDSPYSDPTGVSSLLHAYATSTNREGRDLLVFVETYKLLDGARAERRHIVDQGNTVTVSTDDLAEAILFLRAQEAGDPRVAPVAIDLSFEALSENGEHIGNGRSAYSFPDLEGVYVRIREHDDGFSGPFDKTERHPTANAALTAAHENFMDAIAAQTPTAMP
jgi:hypothetical protein